ncbi:C2 domain-containing protein [Psidium guajava]|nr:C2 domain-containing protein [Psidium guajava]
MSRQPHARPSLGVSSTQKEMKLLEIASSVKGRWRCVRCDVPRVGVTEGVQGVGSGDGAGGGDSVERVLLVQGQRRKKGKNNNNNY